MKNGKYKIFALTLALTITLILSGCSKNEGQSEGTGNQTVGAPVTSASDTGISQTVDGGNADTSADITAPDTEAAPAEGATIPEDWHRILV